jgi:hypothetical protein
MWYTIRGAGGRWPGGGTGFEMSFLVVAPEWVSAAATDVANSGSAISQANAAAALPITSVLAAAGDEVSAGIAALFSTHAQQFQTLSAQAATFHQQFVNLMNVGAAQYLGAESASVSRLQTLQQELPSLAVFSLLTR